MVSHFDSMHPLCDVMKLAFEIWVPPLQTHDPSLIRSKTSGKLQLRGIIMKYFARNPQTCHGHKELGGCKKPSQPKGA